MDKLELKHLAPYLPYGLKGIQEVNGLIWWLHKESNICRAEDNYHSISVNDFLIFELKPILRPLSELEKEISYNGVYEMLGVFIGQWQEEWVEHFIDFTGRPHEANIELCPYDLMQLLLMNHFDVFGLIPKGLAIDINTLENA